MLRIPDCEAIRSPEAYLFTVALHVAQQHAMQEIAAAPAVDVSELLAQLHAATDSDPAVQAQAEQSLEEFVRALERLSSKVRATFILHRHYGITQKRMVQVAFRPDRKGALPIAMHRSATARSVAR